MHDPESDTDAIVIGGGFYGLMIATYLREVRALPRVTVLEREPGIMRRASYNNQARIHNGYHYPRSFTTAYRSRVNLPRFVEDWPFAVVNDFPKIYAIARRSSKVTAQQFRRFSREIGASLEPAPRHLRDVFSRHLIEDVFLTQEYAFDSSKLSGLILRRLQAANVELRLATDAVGIEASGDRLSVHWRDLENDTEGELRSPLVFNCTYSGINRLANRIGADTVQVKHEVTEMALTRLPPEFGKIGITVMDGPFFSIMPFPARDMHTVSHVRYTPHVSWPDEPGIDPYRKLEDYPKVSRSDRMLRDISRYIPAIASAQALDSLYEVKTVLMKNESDDGRPILFQKHTDIPGYFSVLGGKIDNIYDILERLDAEPI